MSLQNSSLSEEQLLNAVTRALSQYISETDPYILFNGLLNELLELTKSEYGFIGEVFHSHNNDPYIKSYATTDISWDEDTQQLYNKMKKKGMEFSKLDSLYGTVLKTGEAVISNQPSTDPRSYGIPKGHPPLNKFLGLPFYSSRELLGVVGIANRRGGYEQWLVEYLKPFLTTCGNLIQAYRNNLKLQQIKIELIQYQQRLTELGENISLGNGYEYNFNRSSLLKNHLPVLLTRNESLFLHRLVKYKNQVVNYQEIEQHVWNNVIVGESSLRTLTHKLRKKLPGLSIKTISGVGYMIKVS